MFFDSRNLKMGFSALSVAIASSFSTHASATMIYTPPVCETSYRLNHSTDPYTCEVLECRDGQRIVVASIPILPRSPIDGRRPFQVPEICERELTEHLEIYLPDGPTIYAPPFIPFPSGNP
jgi:hypothetical protein